jgi:hypothetical protein
MKLGSLANKELEPLLKDIMKRKLPSTTAFRLKTSVKKMREELAKYHEVRDQILVRHGKKDDKGVLVVDDGNVQFSQEGMRAFMAEMTELNNIDVEINTLPIKEFVGVDFTGEELDLLDGLIVE